MPLVACRKLEALAGVFLGRAQLLHQLVSGSRQQHARLVGHEGRAARKYNLKICSWENSGAGVHSDHCQPEWRFVE